MMRLFVAIGLPETVRTRLSLLQGGIPGARWARPEQLHLTLRFIGEVDGAQMRDIDSALAGIDAPAFALTLAGVGHFGSRRKPDMLWVGARGGEPLTRLRAKIENAMVRLGLEPDRRKFQPHVTLARLKEQPGHHLAQFMASHSGFALPPIRVEGFQLYSSFLSSSGAIYREEADYALERALA